MMSEDLKLIDTVVGWSALMSNASMTNATENVALNTMIGGSATDGIVLLAEMSGGSKTAVGSVSGTSQSRSLLGRPPDEFLFVDERNSYRPVSGPLAHFNARSSSSRLR